MTKWPPALTALTLVPIAFALPRGFGKELGPLMLTCIKHLAPTGIMLMFATYAWTLTESRPVLRNAGRALSYRSGPKNGAVFGPLISPSTSGRGPG